MKAADIRKTVEAFASLYKQATGMDATHGIKVLIEETIIRAPLIDSEWHGPAHWLRVANNAILLLARAEVAGLLDDFTHTARLIGWLFGLTHDSVREDEGECPEHGMAAAMSLVGLGWRGAVPDECIQLAAHACALHTIAMRPRESILLREHSLVHLLMETRPCRMCAQTRTIIGLCLDADRLDLPRVGITPSARFMFDPKSLTLPTFH